MQEQILDTIIIGVGQSGLAMAYYLKKINRNFLVLDGDKEIGGAWLKRWDSLKLFTPTEFNHLPGMHFPCPKGYYPNKFEVAQYLKDYVKEFDFNIKLKQVVFAIEKENDVFRVECQNDIFYSKEVVVATGPFHIPFTPSFSKNIPKEIKQLHSKEYRNPSQLQKGTVCVVGGGDSGVQIAKELANQNFEVILASDQNNFRSLPQSILGKTLWWWFEKTGLLSVKVNSKLGKFLSHQMQPVIGTNVKALLAKENVTKAGRAIGFNNNTLEFKDYKSSVKNIIWATGYKPDFSMLKFDQLLDKNGYPKQERGICSQPGLYFIGLPWMYTRGSATLGGVGKDAAFIAERMKENQLYSQLDEKYLGQESYKLNLQLSSV